MSTLTDKNLMASFVAMSNRGARSKPWKARVKIDWVEQFLGYYPTKEEAEQVEREFKNASQ